MSSKEKILQILVAADEVLSGEKISSELGVSRVSVWKHIKAMNNAGIPIVSSPKGYLLTVDPDSLHPIGFGRWEKNVHYFPETSSTMDRAMELARQGCPGFSIVVTDRQAEGRGRMRRVWFSDDGGLFFTIIIRPAVPVSQASLVNLAAAVEMNSLLRSRYKIQSSLKWPNDILVGSKKICGFLSHMESEGDLVDHLNIGIGLNVNNNPEQQEPGAISMKDLLGSTIPRREVLLGFLDRYEQRLERFDPGRVIEEWRAANSTIGRQVKITTLKGSSEGKACGIDDDGGLILEMADGSHETVVHGDCFYA